MEAAFFDLDKTVIAKASMVAFGRPLLREGMISRPLLLRAMWSHLVFQHLGADEERMAKFRSSALRLTTGWEQHRVNSIVADTLIEVIEPIVFDEALALIRQHQADGRRVFIISASPEEIVKPLAGYLGVDEAIASRALLDDEGRYTGEVAFYSYGPYKAEAMVEVAEAQGIDLEASFAYSDSITDLPMLELVGNPVVVNPDRELGRIARSRGWEVRNFRHPVPLRDRVPMPRPRFTQLALVAAAFGAGAAFTWWLLRASGNKRVLGQGFVRSSLRSGRTGHGSSEGAPTSSHRRERLRPGVVEAPVGAPYELGSQRPRRPPPSVRSPGASWLRRLRERRRLRG